METFTTLSGRYRTYSSSRTGLRRRRRAELSPSGIKNALRSLSRGTLGKQCLPQIFNEDDLFGKAHTVITNKIQLPVKILPQPDETTCGPTCLHAVYRYWGDEEPLEEVIARAGRLEHGGTFAVFLACDALRKGYQATIYTYNLTVFDPTWFTEPGVNIAERLRLQREVKMDYRLQHATTGYLEFLNLGGRLRLKDLSRGLIQGFLRRGVPIITGLSSTYLYRVPREYGPDDVPDDIRGLPSGHFVVIAGYDRERRKLLVVDPYHKNPYASTHEYWLSIERVVGAVLLGIVTHDANLLVIHPPQKPPQEFA